MSKTCFDCGRSLGADERVFARLAPGDDGLLKICSGCFEKRAGGDRFEAPFFNRTGLLVFILSSIFTLGIFSILGLKASLLAALSVLAVFRGISRGFRLRGAGAPEAASRENGIEPAPLRCCRNCVNFHKVKDWAAFVCRSDEMPEDSKLPCRILEQTRKFWIEYFRVPGLERNSYPKPCVFWKAA